MIINGLLTIVAVILGYLTLGIPGAALAAVAILAVVTYDIHRARVERHETAVSGPPHVHHQSFLDD